MNSAIAAFVFFYGVTWAVALSTVMRFRSFNTHWWGPGTTQRMRRFALSFLICNLIPIVTIWLVVLFQEQLEGSPGLQPYEVWAAFLASLSALSMSRLLHGSLLFFGPNLYAPTELQAENDRWTKGEKLEWWGHFIPGLGYLIIPWLLAAPFMWWGLSRLPTKDEAPGVEARQAIAAAPPSVPTAIAAHWSDWTGIASLTVALVAVVFTIRESRLNNSVVVELLDCGASTTQSIDENSQHFFHTFELKIKNKGLPLYAMHADIHFNNPGSGTCSIRIPPQEQQDGTPQFSKGMIATFVIKSYLFREQSIFFRLTDPVKQQAVIRIFSQGYLVWTFRAWTRMERLKLWWNGIAIWWEMRFWWSEKREGDVDLLHTPLSIPKFLTVLWPIESFFGSLRPRTPPPASAPASGDQ